MSDRFEIDCHFMIIDDIIKVARTMLNVLHPQRCICIFHSTSLTSIKRSTENVIRLIEAKSALLSRLSGTDQKNGRLKKDAPRNHSREFYPFSKEHC